jgi:hypothetical protein
MSDTFLDVPFDSTEDDLQRRAFDVLRGFWENWTEDEGDLGVIMTKALAPLAQNSVEVASRVPSAIWRSFGTSLVGVPYSSGSPAYAVGTFTLTDNLGHTIPSGTEVDIDGHAFYTTQDVIVAPGATSVGGVTVLARESGTDQNGLAGDTTALLSPLAFVTSFTVDTPSQGGVAPDDDFGYQNRLVRELMLSAKTLVTARDYELMASSDAQVGRAIISSNPTTRAITVTLQGPDGLAVDDTTRTRVAKLLDTYRQVTWTVTVVNASYSSVSVTFMVKALPGYDKAELVARAKDYLTTSLSPGTWGRPKNFEDTAELPASTPDRVVRVNKVIDLLGDVDGVDYVVSVTLGGNGTIDSGGNLTMSNPLPQPGTMTGTAT